MSRLRNLPDPGDSTARTFDAKGPTGAAMAEDYLREADRLVGLACEVVEDAGDIAPDGALGEEFVSLRGSLGSLRGLLSANSGGASSGEPNKVRASRGKHQ